MDLPNAASAVRGWQRHQIANYTQQAELSKGGFQAQTDAQEVFSLPESLKVATSCLFCFPLCALWHASAPGALFRFWPLFWSALRCCPWCYSVAQRFPWPPCWRGREAHLPPWFRGDQLARSKCATNLDLGPFPNAPANLCRLEVI